MKIKNIFYIFVMLLLSNQVFANDIFKNTYVGAGLGYSNLNFKEKIDVDSDAEKDKLNFIPLQLLVGTKFNQYFGLEFSYDMAIGEKFEQWDFSEYLSREFSMASYELKVIGYYPIMNNQINLMASLGITRNVFTLDYKYTNYSTPIDNESFKKDFYDTALIMGLGAEYKLQDNFSMTALIQYNKASFNQLKTDDYMKIMFGVRVFFK